MSGPIRMLLGPARAHATKNMAEAATLQTRLPDLTVRQIDTIDARRWVSQARGQIARLQSNLGVLEEEFGKWYRVIDGIRDKTALDAERKIFKEWEEGTIEPTVTEGIPVTIDRTRTAIMDLEARIAEIQEAVAWNTPAAAAPATPAAPAPAAVDPNANRLRLAPYELPPFSGERDDWWEFHQAFDAMVDHDARLRPFEKLGTLKRAVQNGKANKLIGSLAITDDNYAVAKKLLEDEYGSKQELIRALNSRLLGLKACNSTAQVREFHTELESICQQLENLGSNIQEGEHVIELISSKLTKPANRELITAQANYMMTPQFDANGNPKAPVWTAKRVRHELGKIVRREGLVERTYNNEHKPSTESPHSRDMRRNLRRSPRNETPRPKPSTALAVRGSSVDEPSSETDEWDEVESSEDEDLTAAVQARPGQRLNQPRRFRPAKCLLCDKDHWMSYCERYPDVGSRVKRLREMERCTRCFAKDHARAKCTAKVQCRRCDANDHKKPLCGIPQRDASRARQTTRNPRQKMGAKAAPMNASDSTSSEDEWYEQPDTDHSVSSGVKLAATKLPSPRKETTLLMCKLAMAYNPSNKAAKREAVVFFDSGSTRSFVSEGFAKALGLSLTQRNELELERFNDEPIKMKTWKTRVGITTPKGKTLNLAVITTPSIVKKAPVIQINEEQAKRLKSGKKVELSLAQADPDIMIGSDYFEQPFQVRWQMRTPGGFSVYKSKIGHLIFGRGTPDGAGAITQVVVAAAAGRATPRLTPEEAEKEEEEEYLVRQFLSLEGAGINDDPRRDAEREAVELVRQGMRRNEEGRYEVPLPWRLPKELPPNNYGLALGRLRSAWRARKDKPEELNSYDRAIRKYPEKGAAEQLSDHRQADGPVSYIPHHGVPKKDGEVRIVFAGNAKGRKWEYSLNQCLLQGPAIGMKNLVGILLRSRLHEIVVIADIEGAFTQISVRVEDRDVMRFLWMKDPKKGPFGDNIDVFRFCRVMFGIVCSPFQLGIVLTDHTAGYQSLAARKIEEELYVDNLHLFGEDVEEVKEWVVEAKTIMQGAHMHLREFASNKDEVLADIPQEERLPEQRQKLLGITWDTKSDEYIFKSLTPGRDDHPYLAHARKGTTKRQVLRAIARHYDPLGLIAPVLVRARLFFQQLCLNGIEWKEELNQPQVEEWSAILTEWQGPEVHVPRKATPMRHAQHQLHIFADASGTTYAVAAYLRTASKQGAGAETHLIFAKSRVKPIEFCRKEKDHDFTPRLELLAVEMAVRVLGNLRDELHMELETPNYIWTDSTCTLGWLNSSERQVVFIENRLRRIRAAPNLVIRHVRSEDNSADLATRGQTMAELGSNRLWWQGPDWLRESPESWPTEIDTYDSRKPQEISVEDERDPMTMIWKALPAIIESDQQKAKIGPESWNEKVVERCRAMAGEEEARQPTAEERQRAIKELVLELQREESLPDSPNLRTFTDAEGIVRVNCGLENAPIPGGQKTPILLPRNAIVTRMIILDLHVRLNHAGVAITLRNLREVYWVPTGRRVVGNVIRRCEDCRPFLAQHYQQPPPPALPRDRVTDEAPFRTTGLDYFGPIKLMVDKEHQRKHWTALFTCLATRSVHLELVDDLTAYSFLLALRRFIAIRGVPAVLLSDNATTFKLGAKVVDEMSQMLDLYQDEAVTTYSAKVGITWKWITERAPWRGGAYEKMVDLVKRALRVVIGRKLLPREVFDTLLKEAAAIVNSRPISFLYESPTEPLPIRPMDFLQPWGGGQAIAGPAEEGPFGEPEETRKEAMVTMWTRINHRLDLFWDAWRGDYLAWLRERAEFVRKGGRRGEPKVGAIVMLGDNPETPRGTWPIGKISELVPSKDGVVRTVKVTLPNNREVKRAVNMVYPLEAEPDDPVEDPAETPERNHERPAEPQRPAPPGPHYGLRSRKIPKFTAASAIMAMAICYLIPTHGGANAQLYNQSHRHYHPARIPSAYGQWSYWTRGAWKELTDPKGLIGWPSGMGCLLDGQNEAQVRAKFKLWTAFDRPPVAKGELNQSTINHLYDWASSRWHDKLVHHGFHQRPPPPTTTPRPTQTPPAWVSKLQDAPRFDTGTQILKQGLSYMRILKRRRRIVGILLGVANLVIEGYLFHRINQLQDQLNKLSLGGGFMERLAEGLEREAEQRRLAMAKAMMEVAMEDTLRTLTEMLQTGRIPPQLLSSEGREKLINTALNGTDITRWTYLRFPTALSQFSRVDIENRGRAWFSREQPQIETLITIPMLEDAQGKPLCGIFVRHMKHIGVPNGRRSLMRLDVPEETVVFPDRILGFRGRACKHRTAEIDVCDPSQMETAWPFNGYCLSDDPRVLPWMTQRPEEKCNWEMVAQGHKECLSLASMESPSGDWRAHTNCKELKIQEEGLPCRRIPLSGNWTIMRIILKDNQTAELGDYKMRNLPNARLERGEKIYLLKQSITRELPPPPSSTGPTLREEIHEWNKNVSKPSDVDPEREVGGVIDSLKDTINSVGEWIVKRYQWIIALAILSIAAPTIAWICCQVGCCCFPRCLKCCLNCWRPRGLKKGKKKERSRDDLSNKGAATKESVELIETRANDHAEDTVLIDAPNRRVRFSPAREGGKPKPASSPAATASPSLPSWATPWRSVTTITILCLCLMATGAAAHPKSRAWDDYPYPGDCSAVGPIYEPEVGDDYPYPDGFRHCSMDPTDPIEEILLDYDEEDIEEVPATLEPRPELAPAIGPCRQAPPRHITAETIRIRRFCRFLGDEVKQRLQAEPELRSTFQWTVAMDTESVQTGPKGDTTMRLAQVAIAALPDFELRYEAYVWTDRRTVEAVLWRKGREVFSGYMTQKTGLDADSLDGPHTKELAIVQRETDEMVRGADVAVLDGRNDLLALQRRHPLHEHGYPLLPAAKWIELQQDSQVRQWAGNPTQPGLRSAFSGAFNWPEIKTMHDCQADAQMTLALYCRAQGLITAEMVGRCHQRLTRCEPTQAGLARTNPQHRQRRVEPARAMEATGPKRPRVKSPPRPNATDPAVRPQAAAPVGPANPAPTREKPAERTPIAQAQSPTPSLRQLTREGPGGWGLFERCHPGNAGHERCQSITTESYRLTTPIALILFLWAKRNRHGPQTGEGEQQWKDFLYILHTGSPELLLDQWKLQWRHTFGITTNIAAPDGSISVSTQPAKLPNRESIKEAIRSRRYACRRATDQIHADVAADVTEGYHWEDTSARIMDEDFTHVAKEWTLALNQELSASIGKRLMSTNYVILGDNWAVRLHGEMVKGQKIGQFGSTGEILTQVRRCVFTDVKAFVIFTGLDSIRRTTGHEEQEEHFANLKTLVEGVPRFAPIYYVEPPRVDERPTRWQAHHRAADEFLRAAPYIHKIGLPAINHPAVGRTARKRLVERSGLPTHLGLQLIVDQLNDDGHNALLISEPTEFRVKGVFCDYGKEPDDRDEPREPLAERLREMLLPAERTPGPSTSRQNGHATLPSGVLQPAAARRS